MLKLYNTLTRQSAVFVPQDPSHVRLYVCGPTVYDTAHIGNARPVVIFDVLTRVLRLLFPRVTYVRNITDVDDKIIQAAQKSGQAIEDLTVQTTEKFHEDMQALGTLPPDIEPRATAHIDQMIALIEILLEKKNAYVAEGHVLFAVESYPAYGGLSRLSRDEQKAGARVEVAPYKRHPADFVLWKPSPDEPGFPGWESPWGWGRPGWHIECSAMASLYLGTPFDIHGGGQDLIFPHHENEIAQSCCAYGTPALATVWMHNGILTVEGRKMSKSLGNFVTVDQVLKRMPGEVIRWLLLATHYRQPLDWTASGLIQAKASLDRLYGALRGRQGGADGEKEPIADDVLSALQDDLNTPLALSGLHALASHVYHAPEGPAKDQAAQALRASGRFLGFLQADPEAWFQGTPSQEEGLSEAEIESLIAQRQQARLCRNFAEGDRLRDLLTRSGIVLEDTPEKTLWRRF